MGAAGAVEQRDAFRATRGNWRSATGSYEYAATDYDVAAFVALSIKKVIFLPGIHSTFRATNADFLRLNGEAEVGRVPSTFNRKPLH